LQNVSGGKEKNAGAGGMRVEVMVFLLIFSLVRFFWIKPKEMNMY